MPNDSKSQVAVLAYQSPLGHTIEIVRQTFKAASPNPIKRISFISGLHGDELEGVILCFRLLQYLRKLKETRPEVFIGEIHVYPSVNPQALSNASRFWPFFGTDMNRLFGVQSQSLPAHAADQLLQDIRFHSDLAVDLHSSNLQLWEAPQIRIIEGFDKKLISLAQWCNVDVIWVHPMTPVFEYTLGYNLNRSKIPTLVVEAGTCLRLDQEINARLFQGLIHLLCRTGILNLDPSEVPVVGVARLINPNHVAQIQAPQSGFFIRKAFPGSSLSKGDLIGELVDPVQGRLMEDIISPVDGFLFTLREMPITYEGAVLARIAFKDPVYS